jgi:hypothetical protein
VKLALIGASSWKWFVLASSPGAKRKPGSAQTESYAPLSRLRAIALALRADLGIQVTVNPPLARGAKIFRRSAVLTWEPTLWI